MAACERFLADHRILVEPACGARLAAVYQRRPELEPYRSVLVIVCGGATATIDQIRTCLSDTGPVIAGPGGRGPEGEGE